MADLSTPNADLLRLGAGQFFVDRHDADGNLTGFRHLGNVETLENTTTDDVLTRRSSMSHDRPIRKRITRQRDVVWRAVGDEWNMPNIALLTMGDVTYATAAATPVTDQVLMADVPAATLGAVLGGQIFFVGAVNVSAVALKVGTTALVADTDYVETDLHMGLVTILADSTVVTDGTKDLTVTYTPQAIAGTESPIVQGGNQSFIYASFLFIEDNSAGLNHIWRGWNASVAPDGAFGLIGDDWNTFALQFTLQDDAQGRYGGSPTSPLYSCQLVPDLAP